ncbi:hypothetical protein [Oligoflexus tunisiensis]|uniref:hypothetical protein n=1 Tax=Oligoflexus tunisiensis TaxID=708132 RepID=UPI00114D26CE|nr:hypothetical protein [Oligoflexus tunisiensis]
MSFSTPAGTTRRPVIPSVASADAEFNHWVERQGLRDFRDANGGLWQLQLKLQQLPHPQDTQATLYRLQIGLSCVLHTRHLVEVSAYDSADDARLLQLLGEDQVPVEMKSRLFENVSLENLRGQLADELLRMRKSLEKVDLNSMRKRVIGQWIDRKQRFGSRIPSSSADKIDLDV